MPEFTVFFISGVIVLGAVVGFLSGVFGVGGGFVLTPLLNIVFGVPINVAVGTSLCQMIGTGTTATLRHWKESTVDVKLAIILLGGTIGGVEIGAQCLALLQGIGATTLFGQSVGWMWLVTMGAFAVTLAVIGVGTLVESYGHHRAVTNGEAVARRVGRGFFNRALFPPLITLAGTEGRAVPLLVVVYFGFGVGVLKGFLGVGGGIVFLPALIYGLGCSTRAAVGTSLFVVVLSSVAGTFSHGFRGNVSLKLVALILISSTLGAAVGAAVHHRLKAHHVRLWFSLIILATLVIIVVNVLARFGAFG